MGLRTVKVSRAILESIFLSGSGASVPKDPRAVSIRAVRFNGPEVIELLVASDSFTGEDAVTTWENAENWNPLFIRSAV